MSYKGLTKIAIIWLMFPTVVHAFMLPCVFMGTLLLPRLSPPVASVLGLVGMLVIVPVSIIGAYRVCKLAWPKSDRPDARQPP